MKANAAVVLVALAAGALGVVASLLTGGPGPWLRSVPGQRLAKLLLSADAPAPPAGIGVASPGQRVPAMTLADLDGNPVVVPGVWAGRPVLVNVWASWCGPCLRELPELQRYAAQQGANGVQVVGIALDDGAAVRSFLQRVPVSYPILVDRPGPADAGVRLGNPKGVLPYSVLIGADGRLLKQRIGPFAEDEIPGWARD